jgi:hypothetical protein
MHLHGAYVPIPTPAPDGGVQSRAKGSRNKTKVRHTGFRFMLMDPVTAGARDKRDGLANRVHFMYQEELVRDGKVTRTDVKYMTLRDIVQDTNAKYNVARVQQRALLDFMEHLYTTPPVSTEHGAPVGASGDGGLERQRTQARGTQFCRVQAGAGA